MYVYIYIYIYIHTYTYIHMHGERRGLLAALAPVWSVSDASECKKQAAEMLKSEKLKGI